MIWSEYITTTVPNEYGKMVTKTFRTIETVPGPEGYTSRLRFEEVDDSNNQS